MIDRITNDTVKVKRVGIDRFEARVVFDTTFLQLTLDELKNLATYWAEQWAVNDKDVIQAEIDSQLKKWEQETSDEELERREFAEYEAKRNNE